MTDRRDTILNIEREPATRIYTDGGGSGLLAGVLIVLLLVGLFALIYFRPAATVVPAPNVTIENPAPVLPAPTPAPELVNPAAPEAPAPVTP